MAPTPADVLTDEELLADALQRRWLKPLGPLGVTLHGVFYVATVSFIRVIFRFRVTGVAQLPVERPVIFAPNHESSLDAPVLASALPYQTMRYTFWAVRKDRVLATAGLRWLNRVAQTIPIDSDMSALATGAAVLRRGNNLVWFPEGTRTRDGQLQEFKYGIGALACHLRVPVIPVCVRGTFEALPPAARFPSGDSLITVRFGSPILADEVMCDCDDFEAYRQFADKLRNHIDYLD